MRICTKKAFLFKERQSGAAVKTAPLAFADVPDWVSSDPLFALAKQDGSLEVIESKKQQKKIENGAATKTKSTDE